MLSKVWNEITYPFSTFKCATVEVWEWISNFMPRLIMYVITYPCRDWSYSMLIKWRGTHFLALFFFLPLVLTHWGRVTHICVSKLTIIGSDNGLAPGRRQAIIWSNAGILLIWPIGTNFSEISVDIHTFSLKKIHFKMSSGKWRLFCLGLNVLSSETLLLFVTSFFKFEFDFYDTRLNMNRHPSPGWISLWLCSEANIS